MYLIGFPVAQLVQNPPAMQETWVPPLGWEDPLEEGMATHSSILAWRFPWTEEPGGLQSTGSQRVGQDWAAEHRAAFTYAKPDRIWKSRDITLPTNVSLVKAVVFPVVVYGFESWIIKKAECQRIDVFKVCCWRRPLGSKKIKPVHPKGIPLWIFIGKTDAEVEAPILWPHNMKSWLTGKDPDAGKDWRQKEKGAAEDEMVI